MRTRKQSNKHAFIQSGQLELSDKKKEKMGFYTGFDKIICMQAVGSGSRTAGVPAVSSPSAAALAPLADRVMEGKASAYRRRLTLYLIGKGRYTVTAKALNELNDIPTRQFTEMNGSANDTSRAERVEYQGPSSEKEVKARVAKRVREMVEEGRVEELLDNGYVQLPQHIGWANKEFRAKAVEMLAEALEKKPVRLKAREFKRFGLKGLLKHYDNVLHELFVDLGYAYSAPEGLKHAETGFREEKLYLWELSVSPQGFYKTKENRVAAVKWRAWQLKKPPREMTTKDFDDSCLKGLLKNYYNHSAYEALFEAGLVTQADEAYMRSHTHCFETAGA